MQNLREKIDSSIKLVEVRGFSNDINDRTTKKKRGVNAITLGSIESPFDFSVSKPVKPTDMMRMLKKLKYAFQ